MQRWSVAAKKSRDVVQRLYDATGYVAVHSAKFHQQQQEMLQRRMSVAPITPVDARNLAMASSTLGFEVPAAAQMAWSQDPPAVQNGNVYDFMNGAWDISPGLNGEAAVNEFWDDMMWDSFPQDTNVNFIEGVGQTDWWPPVQPGEHQQQDWTHWNTGHQQ